MNLTNAETGLRSGHFTDLRGLFMYCESCGSFIQDGESFCSNCGARAPQPIAQPVQPVQPVYQQPVYQQSTPQPGQPVYQQPVYQQPVQPIYQQPAYQQVVVTQLPDNRSRINGAATAGLVFGIITACLCWLPVVNLIPAVFGLIFSIVGLSKRNAGGKGRAIAGLIMSGIGMLISAYVILAVMVEGGSYS